MPVSARARSQAAMTVSTPMVEISTPVEGVIAHSGCWKGYLLPGAWRDDRRHPLSHSRRQVQQPRVAANGQRAQFGQPGAHQQRHAGGNREPGLPRRLQRGPFGRAAAEQDLPAALPPVAGDGAVPVERPVLSRSAGEGLNKERRAIQRKLVGRKEAARLVERPCPAGQIHCGPFRAAARTGAAARETTRPGEGGN